MRDSLIHHLRAGFAGIYLLSHEEPRVEAVLADVCSHLKYQLYTWTYLRWLHTSASTASTRGSSWLSK